MCFLHNIIKYALPPFQAMNAVTAETKNKAKKQFILQSIPISYSSVTIF